MNNELLFRVKGDIKDAEAKLQRLVGSVKTIQTEMARTPASPKIPQSLVAAQPRLTETTMVLNNLNYAMQDAPMMLENVRFGIMGVANNLNMVFQGLAQAKEKTGGWRSAIKAMTAGLSGPMGFMFATTLAITAVQAFAFWLSKHKKATKEVTEAQKEYNDALANVNKSVSIDSLKSQLELRQKLVQAASYEVKSLQDVMSADKIRRDKLQVTLDNELKHRERFKSKIQGLENARLLAQTSAVIEDAKIQEQRMQGLDTSIKTEYELEAIRVRRSASEIAAVNDEIKKLDVKISKNESTVKQNEELITQEKSLTESIQNRISLLKKAGLDDKSKEIQALNKLAEIEVSRTATLEDDIQLQKDRQAALLAGGKQLRDLSAEEQLTYAQISQKLDQLGEQREKALTQDQSYLNRVADQEFEFDLRRLSLRGLNDSEILQLRLIRIQDELAAEKEGSLQYAELVRQRTDMELQIQEDAARKKKDRQERLQNEMAAIIRGEGYVHEQLGERIKAKAAEIAAKMIVNAEFRESSIALIKEKWEKFKTFVEAKGLAMREGLHLKEMLINAKGIVGDTFAAGVKLLKSVMAIPFPGNLIAGGIGLAGLFGLIAGLKGKAKSATAFKDGGAIVRPIHALLGEDVAHSGPEYVIPAKPFKHHMNAEVVPDMMKVVEAKLKTDNKVLVDKVDQLISETRSLPGHIGRELHRQRRGQQ